MNLNFIGIGGAFFPQVGCNCAYIKENNKILFIDFGMDVFAKVIKHNLLENIEEIYVILTHMHGDHIGGLFTFIDYCYFNKKIVVNILNNSSTFTNKLVKLLKITGLEENRFRFVESWELGFEFNVKLEKTTHTSLLECYSIIFEEPCGKVFYTSDSNDVENVISKINDNSFVKIYCEVGHNSPVHIEYNELLKLNKNKLILMHIQSLDIMDRAIADGFEIPTYLK